MGSWKLFNSINTLKEERKRAEELKHKHEWVREKIEEARNKKREALTNEKSALKKELATLGIFAGKRKKEIKERLAQIDAELKKL